MPDIRSQKLSGNQVLAYMGVNPQTPMQFVVEQRAPTSDDYQNFNLGTIWLNTQNYDSTPPISRDIYMLVRIDGTSGTWVNIGGGDINGLVGNDAIVVPPTAGNINVIGDTATGITISGNAGTQTLTLGTISGKSLLQSITTDDAAVVGPNAVGNINVLGTSNVSVAGTPGSHQLELDLGDAVPLTFTDQSAGVATPSGDNLNILGVDYIDTIGSGSTVQVDLINGSNGQVLIGGGSSALWANITGTDGISVTNGPNSIDLQSDAEAEVFGLVAYLNLSYTFITGDGTVFTIPYNITRANPGGGYNAGTGVYTIQKTGYYLIYANAHYAVSNVNSGGVTRLYVTAGANTFLGSNYPSNSKIPNFLGPNNAIGFQVKTFVYLTMGDTVFVNIQGIGGSGGGGAGRSGYIVAPPPNSYYEFQATLLSI